MSTDETADPVAEALALAGTLPAAALEALFARYGRPLALPPPADGDAGVTLARDDGGTAQLTRLRVRTPVDVIANDWFVLAVSGAEPLAMPGPLFAAALAALARARASR